MTPKLSEELRRAAEANPDQPLHVVDATTNAHYVLIRADQYERVRAVFEPPEADMDPRQAYPLVDQVLAADDAHDPALEEYQHYRRPSS